MPSNIVLRCSDLLAEKNMTIAFAESATAGRMAAEFALTPQSGKILTGGLVCYDAGVKEKILKLPNELIEKYSPESAEVTEALAHHLKDLFYFSDILVAVTGLTSPGGSEDKNKPVGTIFLHILMNGRSIPIRQVFSGSPEQIVLQSIDRLAEKLVQEISANHEK
jgi:nicotinamide-nucleotide amidase